MAHITLNSERLNAFTLPSEIRPACPLTPLLFSISLEVLAEMIKPLQENPGIRLHDPGEAMIS